MIVVPVRVSTRYNMTAGGAVRAGTIGLQFSTAGACVFTTGTKGPDSSLVALDTVTMTAVAGQEIETGPIFSTTTLPANTIGIVGR